MSRNKTSGVKKRLIKATVRSYPVPTWVVVKTKRRIRSNPQRRNWRRRKLKVK